MASGSDQPAVGHEPRRRRRVRFVTDFWCRGARIVVEGRGASRRRPRRADTRNRHEREPRSV